MKLGRIFHCLPGEGCRVKGAQRCCPACCFPWLSCGRGDQTAPIPWKILAAVCEHIPCSNSSPSVPFITVPSKCDVNPITLEFTLNFQTYDVQVDSKLGQTSSHTPSTNYIQCIDSPETSATHLLVLSLFSKSPILLPIKSMIKLL